MQAPLQSLNELPLKHTQLPLTHDEPPGHALPQAPQFALSVCGSTHVPEQVKLDPLHTHTPPWHVARAPHL